ncbi:MAG: Sensor histidine kinase LiaS [Planctomycetes bacterium ADurb.Bin126]|nr:MAG: Sensor histidine kinase LiaS [Planctomycetes bacterium ADurb.Bin126]HOD82989.1 PAS domain S-box protein [Phycisphaerae bacterium]
MNPDRTNADPDDNEALRRRVAELEGHVRELQNRFDRQDPFSLPWLCGNSLSTHLLIGLDGHIIDASPTFLRLIGRNRQEVIGRPALSLVLPYDRDTAQKLLNQSLADQATPEAEIDLQGKDGVRTVLLAPGHVPYYVDGDLKAILVTGTDITDRKRAEEALRQSEEYYRVILESVRDAVVVIDSEGRYLFANSGAAASVGRDVSQVVGKTVRDVLPGDFAQNKLQQVRAVIRSGKPATDLSKLVLDGRQVWYHQHLQPLRNAEGQVHAALLVSRDVTEQKHVQEQLSGILSSLYETFVAVYNDRGECLSLWIPQELLERYGMQDQPVAGWNIRNFCPHDEAEVRLQRILQVMRTGQSIRTENVCTLPGGQFVLEVTLSPMRDPEGRISSVVAFVRDVTEQKRSEDALRESEERFRSFAQSARDAIISIDARHRIVYWNQAAEQIFGYTAKEILGRSLTKIMPRRLRAFHRQRVAQRVSQGGALAISRPVETIGLRKDNTEFPVELSVSQWTTTQGVFFTGIARDITERRRHEQVLREIQQKLLHTREEERRRLAAELHDCLGQGLVALHLSLQASLSDTGPALSPALERAVQTCGDLIREVRCISHGLYPPTLESLGLTSALRNLVAYCRSAKVQADLECDGISENTRFDHLVEIAFFRIAQEAVQNALRHGQAGRIRLHLTLKGPELALLVEDDGTGFNPRKVKPGLGLLTMHDRARTIGGRLEIISRRGRTRIRLRARTTPVPDQLQAAKK